MTASDFQHWFSFDIILLTRPILSYRSPVALAKHCVILNTFHLKDLTDIFDTEYRLVAEKTAMFPDNELVFVFRWNGARMNGHWWAL